MENSPEFLASRKDTLHLLSLNPAEQEAAFLRVIIEHELFNSQWQGGENDPAKVDALRQRFKEAKSADDLAAELIRLTHSDPPKWNIRTAMVFVTRKRQHEHR